MHLDTTSRIIQGAERARPTMILVYQETMVIAIEGSVPYIPAQRLPRTEIERSPLHIKHFSRRHQHAVGLKHLRTGQLHFLVKDCSLAKEIEIGVVGQVQGGVFIGGGAIGESKPPVLLHFVSDSDKQIAGHPTITVGTVIAERNLVAILVKRQHVPHVDAEIALSPMQCVSVVVLLQEVFLPVQGETTILDPVRETTNDLPVVGA